MDFENGVFISFSPTGTTRTIVQAIGRGIGFTSPNPVDLTLPDWQAVSVDLPSSGVAVIGVPVYAGRVPREALPRLRSIQGHGLPAVLIVTYGNRAYEDALLELRDLAVEQGFRPVAGGAFIGEHSFSKPETPIAPGRPDQKDIAAAEAFGRSVREKLADIPSLEKIPPLEVPGTYPYREIPARPPAAPETDPDTCILCGTCAELCPTGAIAVDAAVLTDPKQCLLCSACIKNCPTGARRMTIPQALEFAETLSQTCRERKEPEIFL